MQQYLYSVTADLGVASYGELCNETHFSFCDYELPQLPESGRLWLLLLTVLCLGLEQPIADSVASLVSIACQFASCIILAHNLVVLEWRFERAPDIVVLP